MAGRRGGGAAAVYPLITDDLYYQNMIILSLVFAVGASGLNIISGFAGYISLGQGAFIGLGGYTIGVCATRSSSRSTRGGGCRSRVSWPPSWPLVLGLVSLRSRGPSFVIITVAFLFLVQVIAVNWTSLTNGTAGLTLPLPTWDREIINWPFYYVLVAILALQLLMTWWIRRTKLGHGPDRDPRGRDQGRDDRHQPAGGEDHRVRGEHGLRRHGRRGLRLLPDVHRPARHVRHPAQRPARAVAC